MKKLFIFVWSVLSVILMLSCSGNDIKKYNSVKEMTDDAKATVEFISAKDLKTVLESGDKFYLIDCRESDEFDSMCIQGAVNIPRGVLESEITEKAMNRKTTLYIYCSNGDRSALAANILPKLKYSNVKVLEAGFDNWKAKYPKLLELSPVRGDVKTKATAKPSGGCGG